MDACSLSTHMKYDHQTTNEIKRPICINRERIIKKRCTSEVKLTVSRGL